MAAGKLCLRLQKPAGFCRPRPSLAREGNAAAYPPPVFPPVASLPVYDATTRSVIGRSLARRRGMMARTNDAGLMTCWASSGLVLASCLGTSTPDIATATHSASSLGLPPVPEAGATDEPRCLVWLPPCTVMADAMRPLGKPSSCPQTQP